MTQEWQVDGPRVLDFGAEHEPVHELQVSIVGGRVDVVAHDDSPTARVEITEVEGRPLELRWDAGTLTITHHPRDDGASLIEMLHRSFMRTATARTVLSICVPRGTRTALSTVSADGLVSGIRGRLKASTVSGGMTLSDLKGDLDLNTVSGDIECEGVAGPLRVNAVSGTVTVQGAELPEVRISTVSGDIVLDLLTPRSTVTSSSVSGDVTVRAPLTGYDVVASTASGQVVLDGHELSRADRRGPQRRRRVTEGDLALAITAHAVSGNVVLLRADPQDARPAAS